MPVAVKCGECGNKINAPDKARGKAIKCPQCGSRVPVPAATKKKEAVEAVSTSDSSEFLANLDLGKVEDSSYEICPSCGADFPEDEDVCPNCKYDREAQGVSRTLQKMQAPRGPDVGLFYSRLWPDSFSFGFSHPWLAVFTFCLYMFCIPLASWMGFLYYLMPRPTMKGLFAFFAVVLLIVPIGWIWNVFIMTIHKTLEKKKVLGKWRFDFALAAAMGFKFVGWMIAFSLPFLIVFGGMGYVLSSQGIPYAMLGSLSLVALIVLPMFPIVMSHMAMPVEYRGWMLTAVLPSMARSIGGCLMWTLMAIVLASPIIGLNVGAYFLKQDGIQQFVAGTRENAGTRYERMLIEDAGKDDGVKKETAELVDLEWEVWYLPLGMFAGSVLWLAFALPIAARGNGLFTFYFKKELNLIDKKEELKYVAKSSEEKPILNLKFSTTAPFGTRYMAKLVDIVVLAIVGGVLVGLLLFVGSMTEMNTMLALYIALGVWAIVYFVYHGGSEGGEQQASPGKQMMKLFLVNKEGNRPSGGAIFTRSLVFLLLLPITWITIFTDSEGRGVHDMVAGTKVRLQKARKKRKKEE